MAIAPEVAVEVGFGVAEFLALFALIGLLCLRAVWAGTFGAIFKELAHAIDFKLPSVFGVGGNRPLHSVANFLLDIDNYIYRLIGQGIDATQYAWHKLLLWNAYILIKVGEQTAALAYDTWKALERVYHHVTTTAQTIVVNRVPHVVNQIVRTVYVRSPVKLGQITAEYDTLKAQVAKLERTAAHVAARAVAIPFPGLGRVERDLSQAEARIKKLGWAGVYAGVGALGLAIVSRLGLGWTRCSNVKNVGKNVCGMNPSLLESLLADTLLIAGTVSLVEFAEGMQEITKEVGGPIRTFWRAA